MSQVDAKITVRKDPMRPYVGLENIPSRGAHLTGWSTASSSISTNSIFQEGDVLFGKLRPNLRKCVIAPFDGYCSTDILVLRPNTGVDSSFAGKVLRTEQVGAAAEMTSVGTKMPRTSWKHLSELEVFCPSLPEQSKVAQILDTLDTAIHETEAIIAKLKAVKQGLLHDLLTRGIDANGELRPPQAEAPQLYKESALGWIPNEWEVHGVLDVAPADRQCILTGPFGAELGQADFKEEGTPVLRIGNVQAGHIDWNNIQFVTQEKAQRLDKYRVATGDLLFARQGATTGRNALADARAHGVLINYHIIRVAVDHAKCHPTYLYALFNTANAKSQVDQSKGRGTREGINSEQIASLTFALPNPEEQNEAVERIASIDASISDESMLLEKLQLEKSGLMDDLLTGRVRVTPLLEGDSTSQTGQQLAGQMPG
ncbi:MAG: restriction endonuclease subunit S [Proteobacteria bacterium]|nr:restriction endonuclease subunit S [Pseudomonadota bacterium]